MRNLWWRDPIFLTVPIEDILIDPDSRDHIPRVLRALQAIWVRPEIRYRILKIIQRQVGNGIRQDTGRPGMTYWSILVLLLLKQSMKATFDRVTELSNQHENLRIMLQVETEHKDEFRFKRQTITQNVGLISEASWQQINEIVVEMGYNLMANSKATPEQGSCDSYVVETNVRFPTDVRLLHDATWKLLRHSCKAWKVLELRQVCSLKGWRQLAHLRKSLYAAYLVVSTTRKCRSNPEAVLSYLDLCMLRIKQVSHAVGMDPEAVSRLGVGGGTSNPLRTGPEASRSGSATFSGGRGYPECGEDLLVTCPAYALDPQGEVSSEGGGIGGSGHDLSESARSDFMVEDHVDGGGCGHHRGGGTKNPGPLSDDPHAQF